ncbi:hypothetical protein [Pseudonocardia spinosispora]|uniref:hypothetical protein n=1 Tax=Pseudonocardia spinosispora TaxID=103441 RepID=UPI00040E5F99|nr:hypothetical protein [Pseudonocardia spinosispora]
MDGGDLSPVVEFMVSQPGMIERVLAEHIPDAAGDCIGCGGQMRVKWKCVHYECAVLARDRRGRPRP